MQMARCAPATPSQVAESKGVDWENAEPLTEEQVWDYVYLEEPEGAQAIAPDEMHAHVLKELDEVSNPLSIIFEKLCQPCEVPTD